MKQTAGEEMKSETLSAAAPTDNIDSMITTTNSIQKRTKSVLDDATSYCSHELAGAKLRKKLGRSMNESAGQSLSTTSQFAVRELRKMGWVEGVGLGKRRDGLTNPINVAQRHDQAGIGSEKATKQLPNLSEQWWKDNVNNTLAKLASASSSSSKKSKKRKAAKANKDYTDEELFQATGGVRFGMRAAPTKNLHKWTRTEGSLVSVSSDLPKHPYEASTDSLTSSSAPVESTVSLSYPVSATNHAEKKGNEVKTESRQFYNDNKRPLEVEGIHAARRGKKGSKHR